jgi:hypothetical protein
MDEQEDLARQVFAARRGFDQAIIDLGTGLLEGRDVRDVSKMVRLQALSLAQITHAIDQSSARGEQPCAKP